MNRHVLLDRATALIGSLMAGKDRFFSRSVQSSGFSCNIKDVDLRIPGLKEGRHEIRAGSPAGDLKAAYYVAQLRGGGYPTIIYHHGSGEDPLDFRWFAKNTFRGIFMDTGESPEANIIAVRAPFHGSSLREYKQNISYLSRFVAMLSVSVVLIDKLIAAMKEEMDTAAAVSGISLGGWVANLHRSYFNTADVYIPLLAGAALGELFVCSGYRRMTGKPALANPDKIREVLNFEEEYRKIEDDNVFPLLGRYDQFIQYSRQKVCYGQRKINVLEKGHITSSMDTRSLRDHILSCMDEIDGDEA